LSDKKVGSGLILGSWPLLILVAKSIFTLAFRRFQAENVHHF